MGNNSRAVLVAAFLLVSGFGCARTAAPDEDEIVAMLDRVGRNEVASSVRASPVTDDSDAFRSPTRPHAGWSIAAASVAQLQRLEALREVELARSLARTRKNSAAARALYEWLLISTSLEATGHGVAQLRDVRPFVVSHVDGAHIDDARPLLSVTPVRSAADADAWLRRLESLARAVTDEQRRFELECATQVRPPRAILLRMIAQTRPLTTSQAAESPFTVAFATSLSQSQGVTPDEQKRLVEEASLILKDRLAPAYAGFLASLEKQANLADDGVSVARLPDGDKWYALSLAYHASPGVTPDSLHDLGLVLVTEFQARANDALVGLGMVEGNVAVRLGQFAALPEQVYPPDADGRAALVADVASRIAWARTRLAAVSSVAPPEPPVLEWALHPLPNDAVGRHVRPEGGVGARLILSPLATQRLARWETSELAFQEVFPGRRLRTHAAAGLEAAPVALTQIDPPALAEGWALYAGDLAADLGAYEVDPAGRLGHLKALLAAAARLVVDTGVHARGWSRQQAIDYLTGEAGFAPDLASEEVDRIIVRPGRAVAGIFGREKLRRLRDAADRELGPLFDLRAFHDFILKGGSRPFSVIEADLPAWYADIRAAAAAAEVQPPPAEKKAGGKS